MSAESVRGAWMAPVRIVPRWAAGEHPQDQAEQRRRQRASQGIPARVTRAVPRGTRAAEAGDPWDSYAARGERLAGDPVAWFRLPGDERRVGPARIPLAPLDAGDFGFRLSCAVEDLGLSRVGAAKRLGVTIERLTSWLASPARPTHPRARAAEALIREASENA